MESSPGYLRPASRLSNPARSSRAVAMVARETAESQIRVIQAILGQTMSASSRGSGNRGSVLGACAGTRRAVAEVTAEVAETEVVSRASTSDTDLVTWWSAVGGSSRQRSCGAG